MDLQRTGTAFVLTLSHDEVTDFTLILTLVAPEIAATIAPVIALIELMDLIGQQWG